MSTTFDVYEHYRRSERLFELRDYTGAAALLERLLAETSLDPSLAGHGVLDARLLLARAYFHAAMLHRAEEAARAVLAEDPTEAYAALLLARTLQRLSRPDEAARAMALATALGAPGTGD